jgi:hypothetical protein
MACRAGSADLEKALRPDDLSSPLACGTYLGPASWFYARAAACVTLVKSIENNFFFFALKGLFQCEFNIIPQAVSLPRTWPPAAPCAKTEKVLKNIAKTGKDILKTGKSPETPAF